MPISIAILVSGRGSNMVAILEAIRDGSLDAVCSVVISNKADAPALDKARSFAVKTAVVEHRGLTREEHEQKVLEALSKHQVDFIVLAGYMRVLTPQFLRNFRDPKGYFRIINIHPSLLPAFPGATGYEDAFAKGVRLSGITVHLVDEEVDCGPILAQESFARLDGDTLESFRQRGLAVEHRLLPEVLRKIAAGKMQLLNAEGVCCTVTPFRNQSLVGETK